MQERAHRHKAIAAVRREARMNTIYMVFRVWKGQVDMDTIIGFFARIRAQLHTTVAMHFHYIQRTCPMLRWKLKQDKAAALDEKMGVASTAAANNNTKKLYTILKQLRSYTPKPPKGVQLKSGDMAKSHEQTQSRWREHFRDLLKGKDTDFQSMTARRPEMTKEDTMLTSIIDTSIIMSRGALSSMFRVIKAGQAAGPDCIPGDIIRHAPKAFAGIFYPIFIKAIVRKQEPLAWRGGRMATIWKKKGDPTICSSSRGVFVANATGKAFHKHIRTLLVPYVEKSAAYSQCGGLKHKGTDIAALTARAFLDKCKAQNRSAAILFADVTAAFDSAIRQLLLPIDDKHEGHLDELLDAFTEDEKRAIMDITLSQCAAKEVGAPEHLTELAADVHTATWFSIPGTEGVTETILGTKPGDPLGDLLYNLLMLRVLRALHSELDKEGITVKVGYSSTESRLHRSEATRHDKTESLHDVSYIDDEALFMEDIDPQLLLHKVQRAAEIMYAVFRLHGLRLNFGTGKTEALILLRGRGSKAVKKEFLIDNEAKIPIKNRNGVVVETLRVTAHYKHLGGVINAVGSMAMEARSRAADTWAAASPMMRQLLRSTSVSMKNKVTIVHVLFMTRLLYNAGTWSKLSEDDEKVLQRTLVQIVRCVTGETYQHGKSLKTARGVLAKAGLPCIEILLKQARLNMLTRVATCMSPQLHAIIQVLPIRTRLGHRWSNRTYMRCSWQSGKCSSCPTPWRTLAPGASSSPSFRTSGRNWSPCISRLASRYK